MELSDIGQELKAERQRQGLSLDKVHEDTRIGLDFLESLEAGNSERLSHPVYAKGFVQNYARYLGLDWKKIGDDFARIYSAEDQFEKIDPEDLPTSLKYTDRGGNLYGIIKALVMLTALIIILASGWYVYTTFNFFGSGDDQQEIGESEPSSSEDDSSTAWTDKSGDEDFLQEPVDISETKTPDHVIMGREDSGEDPLRSEEDTNISARPETAATDESLDPGSSEQNSPGEETEPAASEAQEAMPDTDPEPQESSGDSTETAADQEEESVEVQPDPAADQAASSTGMSVLEIQAREDCWLMAMIDGSSREIYLRAGEDVSFEFKEVVRLTLGNAGGIDVFLNEEPFPIDAESGEVRTLDITAP